MKLLIWYWGRKGGGAKYSEEIAKSFINIDKENTFLSFSKQSEVFNNVDKLTQNSLHIKTYENKLQFIIQTMLLPILIVRFIYFIRKNKIDCVVTTMPHIWTIAILPFLNIFNIKHVVTIHDATSHPGDSRIWNIINPILIKLSHKIIVLSKHVQQELERLYSIDTSKLILSKHGILSYKNLDMKEKDFLLNDGIRLIFFGRIEKYKGLQYLLKAQIELEKKYNNIYLEIYGSGDLSAYSHLIEQVKYKKIENRWIDDNEIYNIFSSPCINIATYIEASQSGTIPIALSCGVPSIVTNIGGLSEQTLDKKTGLVIEINNIVDDLVHAIEYLYNDKTILNNMSKHSIHYVKHTLNWKHICLSIYQKLQ